ncbi:hypothetical protein V6N13_092077 [Hibiscus sabdariffa]
MVKASSDAEGAMVMIEEQSSCMKAGVMLDDGIKGGSLILGKLLGEGSMEVGGELDEDDEGDGNGLN